MKNRSVRIMLALLCATGLASPAAAIDGAPGDYAFPGDGRTLFLTYGQATRATEFSLDGAGEIPGSRLNTSAIVLRMVHYREIGGRKYSFQAFGPVGKIGTARIGGADAPVKDGIGDLTVAASTFFAASSDPAGSTVGLTMFLTAPTGAYEFGKVSLGSGTWSLTPQIGVIQGFGNGLFFDGYLDATFRRDHTEDGVEISQDPSIQVQAYLRYQPSMATSISVGYSGIFDGKIEYDGVYTGQKTRVDQLRFFTNHFVTEDTQLQLQLARDIKVEGGFKNDAVAQIRFLKVF